MPSTKLNSLFMYIFLSKVELIKYFFSVKIHVFRVKNFDMLKNEILKKQTKITKI